MNADGSNKQRLTKVLGSRDGYATWSPDGSQIAIHTSRNGYFDSAIVNLATAATGTSFALTAAP